MKYYQQESAKLRRQIRDIQNLNRHILGDSLGSLNLKELKNLEGRLEKGISRVRSKKVDYFRFLSISYASSIYHLHYVIWFLTLNV